VLAAQPVLSQKNRRTRNRSVTARPPSAASASRRRYQECTRADAVPQRAHTPPCDATAASMITPPPESSDRTSSIDKPPKCGKRNHRRSETHTDHDHAKHSSNMRNTRATSITKFEPEPSQGDFHLATDNHRWA